MKMEMNGVGLATRFAYPPNSLKHCGPGTAPDTFLKYLENKKSEEEITKLLARFEGLAPYLKFISRKQGLNMFDYKVVESYVIGNELLDKFNYDDMKGLLEHLGEHGLVKSLKDKLVKELPEGMVPHHNFNVFYVGVGNIAGLVETTLDNMDQCRVSVGRVIEPPKNGLIVVSVNPLISIDGKLRISEKYDVRNAVYDKRFISEVKKDDYVGLHWGRAFVKLTEKQAGNIEKYTNKILEAMYSSK